VNWEVLRGNCRDIADQTLGTEINRVRLLAVHIDFGREHACPTKRIQSYVKATDSRKQFDEREAWILPWWLITNLCVPLLPVRLCTDAETRRKLGPAGIEQSLDLWGGPSCK